MMTEKMTGSLLTSLLMILLLTLLIFNISSTLLAQENDETDIPEIDGVIEDEEYSNFLETDIGLDLYWDYDEEYLYLGLVSPGSGWLAFGIEPTLRMRDARIIIASLEEEELKIESHIGTSPTAHAATEEDYTREAAASLVEDQLTLETKIPLQDEDFPGLEIIPGESYTFILAYHNSSTSFTTRHSARTTVEIEI